MNIPNSIIYVVGDVLGSWYASHSKLNTLFGGNDFPGDPPAGNCVHKSQEWLKRANNQSEIDPIELLGRVLTEFMNLDQHDNPTWEEGFKKVTDVLGKNSLAFELNGIVPKQPTEAADPHKSIHHTDVAHSTTSQAPKVVSTSSTTISANLEPSMTPDLKPIFISYAHEDNDSTDRSKRWLDRLKQFLEPLVQQDELTVCSDQDIDVGDDWHAHIQKHLNGARAVVLLISPAFLASKYVRNSELPVLLRNANEHGVKIIPVIVKRCAFEEARFKFPDPKNGPEEFSLSSLQAANSPATPLSAMIEDDQDQVLLKVARALINLVGPRP